MPAFKLAYSCELIFVFLFSKLGRLNTHIYLHCLELIVQAAPETTAASLAQVIVFTKIVFQKTNFLHYVNIRFSLWADLRKDLPLSLLVKWKQRRSTSHQLQFNCIGLILIPIVGSRGCLIVGSLLLVLANMITYWNNSLNSILSY